MAKRQSGKNFTLQGEVVFLLNSKKDPTTSGNSQYLPTKADGQTVLRTFWKDGQIVNREPRNFDGIEVYLLPLYLPFRVGKVTLTLQIDAKGVKAEPEPVVEDDWEYEYY